MSEPAPTPAAAPAPRDDIAAAGAAGPGGSAGASAAAAGAATTGAGGPAPLRPGSRSANRAAKRAATTGVRPKTQVRKAKKRSGGGDNIGLVVLAAIAVVAVAAVVIVANPFGSAAPSPSPVVYGDGTCPTSQPAPLAAGDVYTVTIDTDLGDIVMKVDGGLAPIATGNFVALIKCHYYDGVGFHRLVPGFVIQGGDPSGTGGGPGPGYRISDDPLTTTYHRGTVAMARSSGANSQGSQFFIVLDDSANAALTSVAYPYAVLGEVTSGMDIVDAIAAEPNQGSGAGNAAVDPVIMNTVTVVAGAPPTAAPTAAPSVPPTTAPTAAPTVVPTTAPAS